MTRWISSTTRIKGITVKRVLTLLFLFSMCTACTIMIVPHSSSGKGQSIVYMAVTQGESQTNLPGIAANQPSPGGPYLGLSTGQQIESEACLNLQVPAFSPVPPMTPLTATQRNDKTLVENTLVDYILNLRAYIAGVIDTSNKFYTSYASACKNVAQPSIK